MYTTCAFCNGKLDGDGGPSGLGVGRRLAFDEWKGRLWVVCPRCSRWNFAPLEERWEKVEALARAARAGRVAAATAQVALIRWQAYDLVQVGKPPRLELATWRYGERLKARRREQMKFVVPLTVAALGVAVAVNVAAGGSFGVFVWNMPNFARSIYTGMVGRRRIELVEPPVCERCGTVLLLRAKQVARARLTATQQADLALLLTCPNCGSEAAMLTGPDAAAALRRGLTYLNLARGGRSSKSFINEGHWKEALDSKPDYIFIQFGHNDQPGKGPERETDPKTTYPEYQAELKKLIEQEKISIKAKGSVASLR